MKIVSISKASYEAPVAKTIKINTNSLVCASPNEETTTDSEKNVF